MPLPHDYEKKMTNPTKYLIAIASYNEIENIPLLVETIFNETDAFATSDNLSFDILVVDDNSPDGTGNWCDANSARFPRLKCLHRAERKGLGTAVIEALQYAIQNDYDRVINMDGDFSHHPRYLRALSGDGRASESRLADVVIGSRYVSGGGVKGWSWRRHFMSSAINLLARTLLGLHVRDLSGSFRNYSVPALRKLDFSKFQSRGYSFFEEILWRLKLVGADFEEIPIIFEDRQRGKSKINLFESLRAVWTLFSLRR
ncbi:MAG: polyprenol monophosphomannose synthase [Planctomycetia bacterium]|nr:polyprenol monophosphomannose synthase [Planctomycetia bacterium]